MTKPIVAAATMLLIERGRFGIDDPVETFIPELANRRVLRSVNASHDDNEPARRSITVRHLMTRTIAFGSPKTAGPHPVMQEAARLQLGLGPPKPAKPHEPDEWIRRFASLPLMAHPGDAWMYDVSFSILACSLAVPPERRLAPFSTRIFSVRSEWKTLDFTYLKKRSSGWLPAISLARRVARSSCTTARATASGCSRRPSPTQLGDLSRRRTIILSLRRCF